MTNKSEAVDNKEDMACNIESLSNTKRDTKGTANPLVICFEKGICIIFQKMKKYLSVIKKYADESKFKNQLIYTISPLWCKILMYLNDYAIANDLGIKSFIPKKDFLKEYV